MSGKVLGKVMNFLGLEDDYEIEDNELEEKLEETEEVESIMPTKRQGKVVNIHTAVSAKIVIVKPSDYEEAINICDNLKNRKIVVVNTSMIEAKIAQRLLDFIGGASYALGGELQEVERGVYILTPSNVEVTNELKNALSSRGILNWNK